MSMYGGYWFIINPNGNFIYTLTPMPTMMGMMMTPTKDATNVLTKKTFQGNDYVADSTGKILYVFNADK